MSEPQKGRVQQLIESAVPMKQGEVKAFDRVTFNLQFYVQQAGMQALQRSLVGSIAQQPCEEQVYVRHVTATNQWARLDRGWLEGFDIAFVLLQNRPESFPLQATAEKIKEFANRKLEVRFNPDQEDADLIIPSGQFLLCTPARIADVAIRSAGPTFRYELIVVPK